MSWLLSFADPTGTPKSNGAREEAISDVLFLSKYGDVEDDLNRARSRLLRKTKDLCIALGEILTFRINASCKELTSSDASF